MEKSVNGLKHIQTEIVRIYMWLSKTYQSIKERA